MNVVSNNLKNGKTSDVVVGSGYLYACEYSKIANPYAITDSELELFEEIGYIESNATLSAKATSVDVKTANYGKIGKIYSDKAVSFVTGVISWNMEHIAKYLTGSEYGDIVVNGGANEDTVEAFREALKDNTDFLQELVYNKRGMEKMQNKLKISRDHANQLGNYILHRGGR